MLSHSTKTQKPSISIALATFNGSRFISAQINSIKKQTLLPDQLVICDDHSSDDTIEKVRSLTTDIPFKVDIYSNSTNMGYTSNFEKTISYCSGEFIFLCDQDDVWDPMKIETIINYFYANPSKHVIIHDLEYCDESLHPIGQTKIQRIKHLGDLNKIYVTGMATAVRRSFLDLCLPIPKNEVVTHDFWIHICANLLDVKMVVPDILALYRRHQHNATSSQSTNTPNKTSKLYFNKKYLSSPTKKSLQNNLIADDTLINWVMTNNKSIQKSNIISNEKLIYNINLLHKHRSWHENRLRILEMSHTKRFVPVLHQLLKGGYTQFSGIKSALKDILFN